MVPCRRIDIFNRAREISLEPALGNPLRVINVALPEDTGSLS
jgi:hypothetical protein